MKLYILSSILVFLFNTNVISQSINNTFVNSNINIESDSYLDTLINLYSSKALKAKTERAMAKKLKSTTITTESGKVLVSAKSVIGYRIMVLTTEDRNLALKTRALLLQNFSSQKPHYDAKSNLIKIKFGDFESETEANKFIKKIENLSIVNSPMYLISEPVTIPIIKKPTSKTTIQKSISAPKSAKEKKKAGMGIIINT